MAERLYLNLMKKVLMDDIHAMQRGMDAKGNPQTAASRQQIEEGLYWPDRAHTMIGLFRLDNIQSCIETVLKEGIAGDLIETGVWRGGATIFMKACLEAYTDTQRRAYVADSFEGLPPPDP